MTLTSPSSSFHFICKWFSTFGSWGVLQLRKPQELAADPARARALLAAQALAYLHQDRAVLTTDLGSIFLQLETAQLLYCAVVGVLISDVTGTLRVCVPVDLCVICSCLVLTLSTVCEYRMYSDAYERGKVQRSKCFCSG